MMATSEVKDGHCGTSWTSYLKDGFAAHPSRAFEEKEATVCFDFGAAKCFTTETIKIKKCGNFFIYNLPNTDGCDMGYCGQQ